MREPLPLRIPGVVSIPFFGNLFSIDGKLRWAPLKFKLGSGKVGPGTLLAGNNILCSHPSAERIRLANLRLKNQESRIIAGLCVNPNRMRASFPRRCFDRRMAGELPSPGRPLKSSIVQKCDSFTGTIGGLLHGFGQNRTPCRATKGRYTSGCHALQKSTTRADAKDRVRPMETRGHIFHSSPFQWRIQRPDVIRRWSPEHSKLHDSDRRDRAIEQLPPAFLVRFLSCERSPTNLAEDSFPGVSLHVASECAPR